MAILTPGWGVGGEVAIASCSRQEPFSFVLFPREGLWGSPVPSLWTGAQLLTPLQTPLCLTTRAPFCPQRACRSGNDAKAANGTPLAQDASLVCICSDVGASEATVLSEEATHQGPRTAASGEVTCPEQADPRARADRWLPGPGGVG